MKSAMKSLFEPLYIGTYTLPILFGTGEILQSKGKGIDRVLLDSASGQLVSAKTTFGVDNPSFLTVSHSQQFLYAVNELKSFDGEPTGTVSAFGIEESTGDLIFVNRRKTGGTDPCHVSLSSDDRFVFVSNYMTGSVCVLPVMADGSLAEACQVIQHEGRGTHPVRQTGPHAHSLILDPAEKFTVVPDLGLDRLMVYAVTLDGSGPVLTEATQVLLPPGSGPRVCRFSSDGRFCYVVNELSSTITVLSCDGQGQFEAVQTISTLEMNFSGDNISADLHLSPDGRLLYVSNRGQDSISWLRVDPFNGQLTWLGAVSCGGRTPRSFAISPDGRHLVVANQDSDSLVSFKLEPKNGRPIEMMRLDQPTPVCVCFGQVPKMYPEHSRRSLSLLKRHIDDAAGQDHDTVVIEP